MRLNITFILGLFFVSNAIGQVTIKEQNFNRKNLEWELRLFNGGKEMVVIEALGATSSFLALEVCQEEPVEPPVFPGLSVGFPVHRQETVLDLVSPVYLPAGEEKSLSVSLFPLPQAVCDYWETEVQLILGTGDLQKLFTTSVTITEDDYYDKKDWLDLFRDKDGDVSSFTPKNISRPKLREELQSEESDRILRALADFNDFYWPVGEANLYLKPLLEHKDSMLQLMALETWRGQQQKLAKARTILARPQQNSPARVKEAVEGLGHAHDEQSVELMLQFWKVDKNTEPHLVARSLIKMNAGGHLDQLRKLALELEQAADLKSGFSHDRWKWLTAAALLAHYGDMEGLPILERSFDFMLNNFEYRELQLLLEALNRSDNEALKQRLNGYFDKAIKVNYSEELTLAALPLYLAFSGEPEKEKVTMLTSLLTSENSDMRKAVIRQAGMQHFVTLLPLLKGQMNQSRRWEERFYLKESMGKLD